ncbi:MAG TPA: hypothetical protein PKA27_09660 [Fimbriimonadaceae bacterium]|nr:hypothetical protein [Fimbriimonadaceae bacterium]
MISIAVLFAGQMSLYSQAKAAYRNLDRVRVDIVVSGPDGRFSYQLSSDSENRARLSVTSPARKGFAATRRIYAVDGAQGIAFDPANQKFVKRTGLKGSLTDRLGFIAGGLEAPVEIHLDADSATKFLESLEAQKGWKQAGNRVTLQKSGQSVSLDFNPRSLISKFEVRTKNASLIWTASYGKFESGSFILPTSAIQVDRLDSPRVSVLNADAASKATLESSIRAYDRLRRVSFESNGITCHYSNGSARQVSRGAEWSYTAGVVTIVDHKNRRVQVKKTSLSNLGSMLASNGMDFEPTLRQLMSGRNVIRRLFTPDLKVKSMGEVVIDGVSCRAIEAKGQGARVSALIRKTDHLAARITFENLNLKGQVLSRSDQVFNYMPFKPENLQIRIPAGYRRD